MFAQSRLIDTRFLLIDLIMALGKGNSFSSFHRIKPLDDISPNWMTFAKRKQSRKCASQQVFGECNGNAMCDITR